MTSNNDLHHYGVRGMRWGVRKKLASLRDRIRGRKKQAVNTGKPLTKAVNEREREFQYRNAYLHRDRLSTKKIKAMNERLKLENEFDKNTRQKAEERQKAATEERARKAKARAKMIDGAISLIKNTPIENLITYDKERYRTDNKYKDEVDDKIEGIKNIRALIGGFSGTASILSQSDNNSSYLGRNDMGRELLLHAALLENEEVLLHGKKWSEEAKARVRQARKAGMSVHDMFSEDTSTLHHHGVLGMRWGKRKSDYSSTPSYKKFERKKASLKNIKKVYKNSKYEVKTAKDALNMAKTNRALQTEQIKSQDWTRRQQKKMLKTLNTAVDNTYIDVKHQKQKVKDIRRQLKDAKRNYRDAKKRRFDDLEGPIK